MYAVISCGMSAGYVLFVVGHVLQELVPGVFVLHKVEGAELAGDVVVADDLVPADAGVVAEPGGELHQAVVTGLVKLSGLVRVTDLDGEGVDIPVVAGGGLFVQGDALDDLAVQADEEVRTDGGGRLVVEIVVLLGGGAGVADVVDDDVIDGLQLFASAAGAVDLDDLLVHPAGGVVPGQLAQLAAGDVGDHGTDYNDGREGDGQHRDQGKLLPAATAAGLPLTSFGRDKPKFKDYLLRSNQPVNYKFEGVEYSITIEEVVIFPQGYAALMTETGLLQDEPSMLLMDLGGWTVDLMRIDNAIPAADTAHSLELGMIRCVDDIREQVRRETGLSLTDAQIENMLAGQPCTVSDTVRDIVNRQGRKYTEHLLSATMEAGFDLHAIPAVLLGGGASVVSRHLSPKDALCKTIFLLDDKVNAVGFERALAAVSRRKSEA